VRTPALDAWRRELATGQRTTTTFDALFHAASAEQHAVEHITMGLPGIAESYLREARRLIRAALKGRAA
jgi:hypothetical protein